MDEKPFEKLLDAFTPTSYKDWLELAKEQLNGASFEKKLVSHTYENIPIQPIYRREDIEGLPHIKQSFPGGGNFVRGTRASGFRGVSWDISQEASGGFADSFNKVIREDLLRGQTVLNIPLDLLGQRREGGLQLTAVNDLEQALTGVDLEKVPIHLQSGSSGLGIFILLMTCVLERGMPLSEVRGSLGMDPVAVVARYGELPVSFRTIFEEMSIVMGRCLIHMPQFLPIGVDGRIWREGGGSAVEELGLVLATAAEYIRQMLEREFSIDEIAPRIRVTLSLGSEFFMEVAKLRAARMLWAQMIRAFGGGKDLMKMNLHTCTARYNKTAYDPYVNVLRATTEAFSGVVGGCDSLHVGAFDEVIREGDSFSRRMARNIQVLLKEEGNLTQVIDPAAGSYFVESLTDQLARLSWKFFQEIEKKGGIIPALQDDFPQEALEKVASKRREAFGKRKDILVGTNCYPYLAEKKLEKTSSPAVKSQGKEFCERIKKEKKVKVTPVRIHRLAQIYEDMREACEAYKESTGNLPQVFLATMGPLRQHKLRADFSRSFFEVGGFAVLQSPGFETAQEAAQAAIDSGAHIVVLCSTDETYPQIVPEFVRLIKTKKPELITVLAGHPGEHEPAYRKAGLDDFIFVKSYNWEFLHRYLKKLGILK